MARRHRFIIDTGKRLEAPYDTIVYQMEPRVFMLLAKGYLDTSYASVDEVMSDLDLGEEAARHLFSLHDVYSVLSEECLRRRGFPWPTDQELLEAAMPYWKPKEPGCRTLSASERRHRFVQVTQQMNNSHQEEFEQPIGSESEYEGV